MHVALAYVQDARECLVYARLPATLARTLIATVVHAMVHVLAGKKHV